MVFNFKTFCLEISFHSFDDKGTTITGELNIRGVMFDEEFPRVDELFIGK